MLDALEFLGCTASFWRLACSADARACWRAELREAGPLGRCHMAVESVIRAACGLVPLAASVALLA